MKKLTDVTRQDLFDIIRDGFVLTADPPIFNKEPIALKVHTM